ncbi:unnamed protein product, partial [Polarella glacialis]
AEDEEEDVDELEDNRLLEAVRESESHNRKLATEYSSLERENASLRSDCSKLQDRMGSSRQNEAKRMADDAMDEARHLTRLSKVLAGGIDDDEKDLDSPRRRAKNEEDCKKDVEELKKEAARTSESLEKALGEKCRSPEDEELRAEHIRILKQKNRELKFQMFSSEILLEAARFAHNPAAGNAPMDSSAGLVRTIQAHCAQLSKKLEETAAANV